MSNNKNTATVFLFACSSVWGLSFRDVIRLSEATVNLVFIYAARFKEVGFEVREVALLSWLARKCHYTDHQKRNDHEQDHM